MASPRLGASPAAATPGAGAAASPAANGRTPLADEAIWKRLREAGFDEETVKRRDKAALIAYITKLESEIYDYQHHMGLLILESKELTSKYEQLKTSAESSEIGYKRELAAQLSALAEARKQEEGLKKALGIEKECVANIEKALHDMHMESAETKVACENKLAEAHLMMEAAQQKFGEAEEKLLAARSMEADAKRTHDVALRSLQDVEAREDDIRRRLNSFESECDAKETEISLQRKSLNDTQKILHEEQESLIERQALLSQREEYISTKLESLSCFEKKIEEEKLAFDGERKALIEEKLNLDLKIAAHVTREEAILQKESLLDKRERDLLILQETIACKEQVERQRLIDEEQSAIEKRRTEFENDVKKKWLLLEEEMEAKRISLDDRDSELNERANSIQEKERAIELQHIELAEKQEDISKQLKMLKMEEENLQSAKNAAEVELKQLQREREDIQKMRLNLGNLKTSLENERKEVTEAQEQHEITSAERNELFVLETKLKEEIDSFRTQQMELLSESDRLQAEKERFEIEWELIDEKKEELQKEAERVAAEREAITQHLKNERENIKQEKDNLRMQFRKDMDSLSSEREEFMSNMQREHANWLSKIHQEREDFKKDFDVKRAQLQISVEQREAEIEASLREREEEFEQHKSMELQYIDSQKEKVSVQLEYVASEMLKLENERKVIAVEREQQERELSEIRSTIELLNIQREKLQEQRELLRADREAINHQIRHLVELEETNIESETRALSLKHASKFRIRTKTIPEDGVAKDTNDAQHVTSEPGSTPKYSPERTVKMSPPVSTSISWIQKCTEVIFKRSPEKPAPLEKVDELNTSKFTKIDCQEKKDVMQELKTSPSTKNVGSLHRMGDKTDVDINHLGNGTGGHGVADNGPALSGRKRFNNTVYSDNTDLQLEPRHKHRKRTRQKSIANSDRNTCERPAASFSQTSGSLDQSNSCRGHRYENQESVKLVTPTSSQLPKTLHFANGKTKSSNDVPSSSLPLDMLMKTPNQFIGKHSVEYKESSVGISEFATGHITAIEQDKCNQDNDEADDDDEGNVTMKEKLWKFLIT